MRTYLDPTAPIATDAIVTDDPKVAMDLAVAICDAPRMSNLAHGLWGYHGKTPEGAELTVQSLGIGGPSAALVMSDLAQLGVRRAIRIGSCIALGDDLELGSAVVAGAVLARDGAGRELAGDAPIDLGEELTAALARALQRQPVTIVSANLAPQQVEASGSAAVADLSSAAFGAAGARDGVECACALVVAGLARSGSSLDAEALGEATTALGARAAAALEAVPQASGP